MRDVGRRRPPNAVSVVARSGCAFAPFETCLLGMWPWCRQTRLFPRLSIAFGQPLTRLDHLYDVDPLLDGHDGRRRQC
jgi:hypothetical protein